MAWIVIISCGIIGFWFWGALEYLIHGCLSHRCRTAVGPLHWSHHRQPRNVFVAPIAWGPVVMVLWGLGTLAAGLEIATGLVSGLLAGFLRYEHLHWRMHFREPASARERLLRQHHLAHHFCNARMYHGVTTRFWDRVCGTLPSTWREDYARVADVPVLRGPSNLRRVYSMAGWKELVRPYLPRRTTSSQYPEGRSDVAEA